MCFKWQANSDETCARLSLRVAIVFCLFRPPRCTPSLAHETQKRTCAAVYVSIVDETVVESKPKSTFVFPIHGPHQNG